MELWQRESVVFAVIDWHSCVGWCRALPASAQRKYDRKVFRHLNAIFHNLTKKNGGLRRRSLKPTVCHRSGHSDRIINMHHKFRNVVGSPCFFIHLERRQYKGFLWIGVLDFWVLLTQCYISSLFLVLLPSSFPRNIKLSSSYFLFVPGCFLVAQSSKSRVGHYFLAPLPSTATHSMSHPNQWPLLPLKGPLPRPQPVPAHFQVLVLSVCVPHWGHIFGETAQFNLPRFAQMPMLSLYSGTFSEVEHTRKWSHGAWCAELGRVFSHVGAGLNLRGRKGMWAWTLVPAQCRVKTAISIFHGISRRPGSQVGALNRPSWVNYCDGFYTILSATFLHHLLRLYL